MATQPIPKNENKRLQALNSYHIPGTLAEKEFDRLIHLASVICDTPIFLVSLVDKKRQWFKSSYGLDVKETSRELAFCQHTIKKPILFEVADAIQDPRFEVNELVTGEPEISLIYD